MSEAKAQTSTTDGRTLYQTEELRSEFGVIRLEEWPEGVVLWVGGQIRWRSWRAPEFCATRLPERKAEREKIQAIMEAVNGN